MKRCSWCEGNDLYINYHDSEWGVPVFDDRKQFEFLVLESAQAGLSWLTILKKRENFRSSFDNFDPHVISDYNNEKIERLLQDRGIIRNRKKIEATVNNAARFLEIKNEFGTFCDYLWGFVDGKPKVNSWKYLSEVPSKTELSELISKDLKKRGFKFLGPTTVYAHMQAAGLVNDHLTDCFRYNEV